VSASTSSTRRRATKSATVWLLVVAGLLLVAGAHAHLVYVALVSQPACVDHVRAGESGARGAYSAARSACVPRRESRDAQPVEWGRS